jgi:hypothetical protein
LNCDELRDDFELIDNVGIFIQNNSNDFEQNRKNIRDSIVDLFKSERAGQGKKADSTRVMYCMEKTLNDEIIYLQRPAYLNKGFDFTVNVKSYNFKAPTKKNPHRLTHTPRHDSIFYPLNLLKTANVTDFNLMQVAIDKIYYCEDPSNLLQQNQFLSLNNQYIDGTEYETLLKVIKWLFIEQDITYWSFSGRKMFYDGLKNV